MRARLAPEVYSDQILLGCGIRPIARPAAPRGAEYVNKASLPDRLTEKASILFPVPLTRITGYSSAKDQNQ